ncbi:MAG TPA: acyl-CoA dehydrogenase family protein [Polyangiaceae bacterium]|nr:acyl-CoA dehydrogenase family protein [Polyangiaceae bacterium]
MAPTSSQRDSLSVARQLAAQFASTAIERDRRGGTPKHERDLIRKSGLLALSIPTELGGWGAPWSEVMAVVRTFARVDGSLAHVFGFQHLMLATARLFGQREQWQPLLAQTAERAWFWGNALNPLDARTSLRREGSALSISGQKSFCSGSPDSDMLIVSALRPPETRLAIVAIPTSRAGITVHADWDNMGQRQTDSGSVTFEDVVIHPHELLDVPGPLGSTFASLRPCIAQLILANVYLGLAEGALEQAKVYTLSSRRAWLGSGVASASEDPYVLHRYGDMWVGLEAARALTDRAGLSLSEAWARGDELTPEQRGNTALAIATAKVSTTRVGLDVSSLVFDVMGARATTAGAGLDRFWRNLRTHTLHDPVDYKLRELGRHALSGELPTPSFYS